MSAYKVGDCVKLKSGGPAMTVVKVEGDLVSVNYFVKDSDNLSFDCFQEATLTPWPAIYSEAKTK